jgi:hypothetical protein
MKCETSFSSQDLLEKLKTFEGQSGYFGMLSAMGYGQDTAKMLEEGYVKGAKYKQETEEAHARKEYQKAVDDATKAAGHLINGSAKISGFGIGLIVGTVVAALTVGAIAGIVAGVATGGNVVIGAGVAVVAAILTVAVIASVYMGVQMIINGTNLANNGDKHGGPGFFDDLGQFFAGGGGNIDSEGNSIAKSMGIVDLGKSPSPVDQGALKDASGRENIWNSAIQDIQGQINTFLNVMYAQAQSAETTVMENMKRLFQYVSDLTKTF